MAASTAVRNTTTGWTTPLQWTATAGGNVVEWYTPQLETVTLTGAFVLQIRAALSDAAANGTVWAELAVVNGDGSGATVFGAAGLNIEPTTSELPYSLVITGQDITVTSGQRLRLRISLDDYESPLVTGHTGTIYYNSATVNTSGDTFLLSPVTLLELPPENINFVRMNTTGIGNVFSISQQQIGSFVIGSQ